MTGEFSHSSSADICAPTAEIKRHPSAALYDVVFATALPGIAMLAEHKNVSLRPDEHEPLLRHALEHVSRKIMRRMMKGNPDAVLLVELAICHSLDVFAAAKMIGTLEAIQGIASDAATLVAKAEEAMKPPSRMTRAPPFASGPISPLSPKNTTGVRANYQYLAFSAVQGTATRVSITKPNKLWTDVIRAATPARENPVHG